MTNILIIYGKKKTINDLKKTKYLKKNLFQRKKILIKIQKDFLKKNYMFDLNKNSSFLKNIYVLIILKISNHLSFQISHLSIYVNLLIIYIYIYIKKTDINA